MFSHSPSFDVKPPKIDFMMALNSILESLWEPGLITFCLLVALVANAGMFFESRLPSQIFSVKSGVQNRKDAVKVKGRRQRRSQRREGEASPPSFERLRFTYLARPATS